LRKPTGKNNYYVLDTSVLLADSNSITHFSNNTVIIPVSVLKELDKHKDRMDEVGKNARDVHKFLHNLTKKGNITKGVTHRASNVKVMFVVEDLADIPTSLSEDQEDDRILSTCFSIKKTFKKGTRQKVTLVTNDYNLALKAAAYNVKFMDYRGSTQAKISSYKGYRELSAARSLNVDKIYRMGAVKAPKTYKFNENEYCLIRDKANPKHTVRCRQADGYLQLVPHDIRTSSIEPLNNEQTYVMDLLLNPDIELVTICGKAGCGKTLLSVACGLEQTIGSRNLYNRLIISRSLEPLSGKDRIGFLKGNMDEKLAPYILPLKDAIDQCLGQKNQGFDYLKDMQNIIEVEPLQYIRGRSIPNSYFIVDEAQNLTRQQIKAIITRMGKGSKIILLGDLDQIDNYYLTKYSNGLAQTVEKFKNSKLAGHIELSKGVRSPLATEAADKL
jgi:PhoH-like ATPase